MLVAVALAICDSFLLLPMIYHNRIEGVGTLASSLPYGNVELRIVMHYEFYDYTEGEPHVGRTRKQADGQPR